MSSCRLGLTSAATSGQALIGLMVVDHDDVGAQGACDGKRVDAGRAAVDGDDELGAVIDKRLDGLRIGAIALGHAVGDVNARVEPVRLQEALEQCGRARAIHVVVAEDGNRLATPDRVGKPGRSLVHVAQGARVGHQRLDRSDRG